MFTLGSKDSLSGVIMLIYITNVAISKLEREGWTWSAHTHPGDQTASLIASGKGGDRGVLLRLNQAQSMILNSTGKRSVFGSAPGVQEHLSTTSITVRRNSSCNSFPQ